MTVYFFITVAVIINIVRARLRGLVTGSGRARNCCMVFLIFATSTADFCFVASVDFCFTQTVS